MYFLRGSNLQRLCYRKFIVRLGRPLADFDAGAFREDMVLGLRFRSHKLMILYESDP